MPFSDHSEVVDPGEASSRARRPRRRQVKDERAGRRAQAATASGSARPAHRAGAWAGNTLVPCGLGDPDRAGRQGRRAGTDRPQPAPHRARRRIHAGRDPAVPGALSRGQQGRADDLDAVAAPEYTPRRQAAPGSPRSLDSGHGRVAARSAHRRGCGPAGHALATRPEGPRRSPAPGSSAGTASSAQRAASGSTTVITKAHSRQHSRSLPCRAAAQGRGKSCCSIHAPPRSQQPLRPNGSGPPATTRSAPVHRDPATRPATPRFIHTVASHTNDRPGFPPRRRPRLTTTRSSSSNVAPLQTCRWARDQGLFGLLVDGKRKSNGCGSPGVITRPAGCVR